MKSVVLLLALFSAVVSEAFVPLVQRSKSNLVLHGYVPDGMSAAQYNELKKKEQNEKAKKKFGAFGPQSFKSRSLAAFQTDLEKGKANHLMPMFNAKDRIKKGEIKQTDIPYMQRGGNWDDSDVKGAKKKAWSDKDKQYNPRDAATASALRLDWGANQQRRGGPAQAAQQKTAAAPPKKKGGGFFGFGP